jgi:hypothetical protein
MYLKEVMCECLVCIISYYPLVKVRSDEGNIICLHKRKEFFVQVNRYQFLKSRPVPQSYLFDNHLFPLSETSRSTDTHELYNCDMSVWRM